MVVLNILTLLGLLGAFSIWDTKGLFSDTKRFFSSVAEESIDLLEVCEVIDTIAIVFELWCATQFRFHTRLLLDVVEVRLLVVEHLINIAVCLLYLDC